ncbi:MAG: phosphodiesterase [Xanthomonadales bacterium]|nr:phosphodiesterase [Xanthomonadales bacterium]NIN75976.1 phosphodiesterase [Xanthomonadales bacterium]NIP13017.1 phosphodiesterase [Xanthomonadales bacterium]NIQ35648.1 phosphodiesterase [Xanthomonadales bacterium]NIT34690.1 phosphodiesterase [Xanthomonadales bacterium]
MPGLPGKGRTKLGQTGGSYRDGRDATWPDVGPERAAVSRELRVLQLTDCHLSADPDARYRGIHARDALEQVLRAAASWSPELLLLTGDLSEDGSEASYAWLAERLSGLAERILAVPGNHDDSALHRRYFGAAPSDGPRVYDRLGWRLVMLDSTVEGEVPGTLSQTMLAGLSDALREPQLSKLVALHHQPLPVGSAWIDRYALQDPAGFWASIEAGRRVRAVTWGHIHHALRARRNGIELLGSPSTASNSYPCREVFAFDPAGPAGRWFKLAADGRLASGLLRPGPRSGAWQDEPQNDVDEDSRERGGQH